MLSFYVMKKLTGSTYFKLLLGSSLVFSCVVFIIVLIDSRPDLSTDFDMPVKYEVKFPTNLPEVKEIVKVLSQYKKEHMNYVILLFGSAYIFKQSFGIPGSFLLNITAGALFGVPFAFFLVSLLTGIGATCCYLMSRYFGRELVERFFPVKITQLRKLIEANEVFFGLMPYNYICVQTGNILYDLSSLESVFTLSILTKMAFAAIAALLPGILIKLFKYRQTNLLPDGSVIVESQEIKID